MKKIIAILAVLALCLSVLPAAFAEATTAPEIVSWADYEELAADLELEGEFYALGDSLIFWVPNTMEQRETDEDGSDYLAYFMAADESMGFAITLSEGAPGLDYDALVASASAKENVSNVQLFVINNLAFVGYTVSAEGIPDCNILSMLLDDGSVLNFLFSSMDADSPVCAIIAASIQVAE